MSAYDTLIHRWLHVPYTLHAREFRNPKKYHQTIIFLHGIGNSAESWEGVVSSLPYNVRAIGLDLLGFGDSPKPMWVRYSIAVQAKAVAHTLLKLRLTERPIIVGHSMGALVAIELAKRFPLVLKQLVLCSPPEKKLIMNNDYQTEFNALMNAVFGIGWEYHRSRPDSYPLIFFDALYVIADKLAPYCTDEQASYDGSDGLFSLMHDVRSFAEVAIIAGNASGTALALRGVNDHMKIAKKNNLDDQVKYCLESILEIGAYAASAHLDDKVEFLMTSDGTVKGEATKIIVENHYGYDLSHAASELIIKFDKVKDYDELKKYLIEVGDAIGTNFGLRLKKEDEKS